MKHPLRDRLLASFPGAIFGGIIREYNTGLSGADVFAARFEPSDQTGLNGTYIIKIVAESSIEAEKEFFNQATSPELARMIAPLCRVSNPIDGFVAVAYEVAFNLESIRTLADILTTETALPEEKVALLIERLCAALVTYHIETDYIYHTATFYQLLELALEKRRMRDISSRLYDCLREWPQDVPQIKFTDRLIINPLWYIKEEAWQNFADYLPPYFKGLLHGDLHTGNIICYIPNGEQDPQTKSAASSAEKHWPDYPKVIDPGQDRAYFSFADLAYLELDIFQHVIRVNNKELREQWFHLFDHVMAHLLPEKDAKWEANKQIKWGTERALKFILPLRRQVVRFINSMKQKDSTLGEAPEINWWLATVAAGLNFARKGSKEAQRPQVDRQVALLYAAYGLQKLHEKLGIREVRIDNPPFVPWADMAHETTPPPVIHYRERYLQDLFKDRKIRDEIDLEPLQFDENMIDNNKKWLLTETYVWQNASGQRPKVDILQQQDQMSHSSNKQNGKAKKEQQEAATPPLPLASVLAQAKRLLLFGDPGMGTSTILHYLLLQIANPSAAFTAQLPQLVGLVPVWIELEDYAHKILTEHAEKNLPISPQPRLEDFISSYLQEKYPQHKAYIEQQIESGNALFLLSDLDAITDEALQGIVVKELQEFTYSRRQNRFIITSRPMAFQGRILYRDYDSYALSGFTEEQIRRFLTQWLQVEEKVERLWQIISADDDIRQLVTFPLFLTIFALLHSTNDNTPFSRNGFFKHCNKLLLRQRSHKNDQEQPPEEILYKVMQAIAFMKHKLDMHKKPMSSDDLIREIESVLKEHNGSNQTKADFYIQFMRKKVGILRKSASEIYDFAPEPLKEHLAAAYIVRQDHIGQNRRHKFIKQHMDDSHWSGVLRHAFALLLDGNLDEDAKRAISDFRDEDMPLDDLILIAKYLFDNPGHKSLEEEIILSIGYHYLRNESDELRKTFAGFLRASRDTQLVKILKDALNYEEYSKLPVYRRNDQDPTDHRGFIYKCLELVYKEPAQSFFRLEDLILRQRTMMLLSLLNMQNADWSQKTIELLNQPNGSVAVEVKQAAIMLLGILGKDDEQAKERLLAALEAPKRALRSAAANALSQLAIEKPDSNIPQILLNSLRCTCTDNKAVTIIDTLSLIGSNLPADMLDCLMEEVFPTASSSVQRAVVLATGAIAPQHPDDVCNWDKIINFLLEALNNTEDPGLISSAALAIRMLANQEAVKKDKIVIRSRLKKASSDSDQQVKDTITLALYSLEQPLPLNNLLQNDQV